MSFSDLAVKLGEKEEVVRNFIEAMIEADELNAKINEKANTVMFTEKEDDFDLMGQQAREQTEKIKEVMEGMKELRDQIETSKVYQKKVIRNYEYGLDDAEGMEFS